MLSLVLILSFLMAMIVLCIPIVFVQWFFFLALTWQLLLWGLLTASLLVLDRILYSCSIQTPVLIGNVPAGIVVIFVIHVMCVNSRAIPIMLCSLTTVITVLFKWIVHDCSGMDIYIKEEVRFNFISMI